jgi:hypothetical protein
MGRKERVRKDGTKVKGEKGWDESKGVRKDGTKVKGEKGWDESKG